MKRIALVSIVPLALLLGACTSGSSDSSTSSGGDTGACEIAVSESAETTSADTLHDAAEKADDVTLTSVLAEAGNEVAQGNTEKAADLLTTVSNYCHRIVLEDEQSQ